MTLLNKITYLVDEAFKTLCVFLAVFVWALYVKKELFEALILASIIAVIILFLLHFILDKKNKSKKLKLSKQKEYDEFLNKLYLSSPFKQLEFFKQCNADYTIENNYLVNNDSVIYIFLKPLLLNDLFSICSIFEDKTKLTIICNSCDGKTNIISKKIKPLEVNVVSVKNFYINNVDACNNFKSPLYISDQRLYTFKLLLLQSISSEKSKKYFLVSLLLIFSMLFTPYKLLYAILSSLCLSLSLISKIQTKKS